MTQLRPQEYTLMGAGLGGENPLPVFRHPNPDHPMRTARLRPA